MYQNFVATPATEHLKWADATLIMKSRDSRDYDPLTELTCLKREVKDDVVITKHHNLMLQQPRDARLCEKTAKTTDFAAFIRPQSPIILQPYADHVLPKATQVLTVTKQFDERLLRR